MEGQPLNKTKVRAKEFPQGKIVQEKMVVQE
jgi:hypothetical protein